MSVSGNKVARPEREDGAPLKILVFSLRYPSDADPTKNPFIREQAKAVALAHEVAVLCSDEPTRGDRGHEVVDTVHDGLRTLRIRYRRPRLPSTPHLAYRAGLKAGLDRLAKDGFRPHLIHAHFHYAGFYATRLGRWLDVPVVISEHHSGLRPGRLGPWKLRRAKLALESADLVCPASHDLGREIEGLGIRARLKPVPNVVDTTLFGPRPETPHRTDGRSRILFTSRIQPSKGLDLLLDALAELRLRRDDFAVDVVGDGPSRPQLEEMTANLGLDDVVTFHGVQPKQQVARFMQEADFFVLPSHQENLPTVLIEAMASGLPVLATDVGGVSEMVDGSRGLLVRRGERAALSAALERMLDGHRHYDRERIAADAASRYGYDAICREFSQIYRGLLAEQDRREG